MYLLTERHPTSSSSNTLSTHTFEYYSQGGIFYFLRHTPDRRDQRLLVSPLKDTDKVKNVCFCIAHVSSPFDSSKQLHFTPLQTCSFIARNSFIKLSELGHRGENKNAKNFETVAKGILTRAISIVKFGIQPLSQRAPQWGKWNWQSSEVALPGFEPRPYQSPVLSSTDCATVPHKCHCSCT